MSVEAQEFRRTLGRFATGVVAVTSFWEDQPYGMTVNSFTSVSLDPPLVLFCSYPKGHTCKAIQASGAYGVSIMAQDQMELCKRFAGMTAVDELDRFIGLEYTRSPILGVPWMADCLAWLECRLVNTWTAGDHLVLLGQVEQIRVGVDGDPLLFFNGQWPTIQRPVDGVG
jgi:3-hydroxy-9,10-secoandrosta-1,3,5(10)-triene-9,17-dione monooxygenase reductase component